MTHSESIAEIAKALAVAQKQMKGAAKDSTNPHFRSKYADLSSVREACSEALSVNGIAYAQSSSTVIEGDTLYAVVTTMLIHTSGEWLRGELSLPVSRADAQGVGSALTYARRYSLAAFTGIAPEDDDGNAAVGDRQEFHPTQGSTTSVSVEYGPLTIKSVKDSPTKNPKVTRYEVVFSDGLKTQTIDKRLGLLAFSLNEEGVTVKRETKKTPFGLDLTELMSAKATEPLVEVTSEDIPF